MVLSLAAGNGHIDQVRNLIERGTPVDSSFGSRSDVERAASQFVSPLQAAAARGHLDVLIVLLDNGADPNRQWRAGETALYLAAAAGRYAIVEALLEGGADPRIVAASGSPLRAAREAGHSDVVSLLSGAM